MKLGDTRDDEAMALVCTGEQFDKGRCQLKHPRNGKVVLKRDAATGVWVVVECERPDPEQAKLTG